MCSAGETHDDARHAAPASTRDGSKRSMTTRHASKERRRALIVGEVIVAAAVILTVGLTRVESHGAQQPAATKITRPVGAVIGTDPNARASVTAPAPAPGSPLGEGAADTLLCGAYSSIHAKMLAPHRAAGDIWVANRYHLALSQFPDASADIRAAITADVDALDAQIHSFPEPPPYEEPPIWHVQEPQATVELITRVCRLGAR